MFYDSSNSEWGATQGGTVDYYNGWFSGCCGSATTFYSIGQIPLTFETTDTSSSDFSGFSTLVDPVWYYLYQGTWYSPSVSLLINSNSANWPGVIVGGKASTPNWFLAAAEDQCSYSANVLEYYYSSVACTGATNADGTFLW